MSRDWFDRLTPAERGQWNAIEQHYREETVQAMDESALVVSIVPSGEPDIKFAVELGLSIMLDKPILAVVTPGATIPRNLRRVAEVVEADPGTEQGQAYLARAVKAFAERHR